MWAPQSLLHVVVDLHRLAWPTEPSPPKHLALVEVTDLPPGFRLCQIQILICSYLPVIGPPPAGQPDNSG